MDQSEGLIQDSLTYSVSYIELFCGDEKLANASGFFWESNGDLFLITNWHNLSGKEPITGETKSRDYRLPTSLSMTFFREVPIEGRKDVFNIGWGSNRVRICDDDWSNHRWFEHPVLGQSVDVAALKLDRIPAEIMPHIIPANRINEFDGKISPQVTQDVYVIGYPIGLIDECPIPIWKRGTIAAEPLLNPGGSKKVFIDTATRKGMSGSLVIAKFEGFGSYEKMDGTQSNTLMWRGQKVFGIYSGRLGAHESMAQLGIVWKREIIDEVVNGAKNPI